MTRSIVIGGWHTEAGMSEYAYGPFPNERAEEIAEQLTVGNWQMLKWTAVPLGKLPGEPLPAKPPPTLDQLEAEQAENPLYQILQQRQGDEAHLIPPPGHNE